MRIVWHCQDRVGADMAGPGIRVVELSTRLARSHAVTVVAPGATTLTGPFEAREPDGLAGALRGADVLVAQGFGFPLRHALRFPGRLVLDLYDPVLLEQLMQFGPRPTADQRISLGHVRARLLALLRRTDHVLCASARQRAFWLGWLGAAGRLGPGALAADPAGRGLVTIVPFGIPEEPPRADGAPLRTALPAIPAGAPLALFWGGLWDWMDPALAVQAVGVLREQGRRVDLVFIAGTRPGGVTMTAGAASARMAAAALHLEDRVHFLDRWIPYGDRGAVLLEADVAVTSHHASIEAELAFRTRVLDCLWAGLPIASTRGDALAEDAEREGWGRCAEPGDAAGLAAAIAALIEPGARARARAAMAGAIERFRWARSASAIEALLERPRPDRSAFLLPGEVAGASPLSVAGALGRRLVRRLRRA